MNNSHQFVHHKTSPESPVNTKAINYRTTTAPGTESTRKCDEKQQARYRGKERREGGREGGRVKSYLGFSEQNKRVRQDISAGKDGSKSNVETNNKFDIRT